MNAPALTKAHPPPPEGVEARAVSSVRALDLEATVLASLTSQRDEPTVRAGREYVRGMVRVLSLMGVLSTPQATSWLLWLGELPRGTARPPSEPPVPRGRSALDTAAERVDALLAFAKQAEASGDRETAKQHRQEAAEVVQQAWGGKQGAKDGVH